MIVLLEERNGICLHPVGLLDRIRVRVRSSRLDRELARGASPESGAGLALHAVRLARPRARRGLATAMQRVMSLAESTSPSGRPGVVRRDTVRHARGELQGVVDRLLGAEPVDVRGVAKVRMLLADGSGPLYSRSTTRDLRAELDEAIAAMELAL